MLGSARVLAARQTTDYHDIYACLSRAWRSDDMRVPYRLLVKAVRAALPYPTALTDYCLGNSRETLLDLYSAAIDLLPASGASSSPVSQRGVG